MSAWIITDFQPKNMKIGEILAIFGPMPANITAEALDRLTTLYTVVFVA